MGGFLVGFATYAIVGPHRSSIDVNVQTALIALLGVIFAASVAFLAAVWGPRIGAKGVRDAAELAQAEARASREDARRVRFADIVRERAAAALNAAQAVDDESAGRLPRPDREPASIEVDTAPMRNLHQLVDELVLVARRPETVEGAERLRRAAIAVHTFRGLGERVLTQERREWREARNELWSARDAFAQAVRAELAADSRTTQPESA